MGEQPERGLTQTDKSRRFATAAVYENTPIEASLDGGFTSRKLEIKQHITLKTSELRQHLVKVN
ncbi:MAG: hypothetical protein AAF497_11005, partial [Planctomycetota bacterium]